ncbi:MAG: N-acetylmuramoyl-L-alanine amidase [Taibaiella sp.]|nr:N-acetylmuramoyl-L-alanine amidase [Taibaiella sp.]
MLPFFASANGKKISKIVLDAGHGGKDIGARGQMSQEKNLTLAIVLRLGRIMNDSMRDVQVIYTRTTDDFPTLKDRHEIANHANADLFLSVHINSTADRVSRVFEGYRTVKKGHKHVQQAIYRVVRQHEQYTAKGTETYVLGLHRNSQKEGAIGEYSENVSGQAGLLNENDPQTDIIIAQYAQAFLKRSVSLGTDIERQFEREGRPNLGVKQKGLEVLAGSAMPGVLVEVGFINNPDEEAYMNSPSGQQEIALALYRGIRAYKYDSER